MNSKKERVLFEELCSFVFVVRIVIEIEMR